MPTLLPVHMAAGGLAILLGAVALLAPKGAWLHRRVGLVFVYAMLIMGVSGSILALNKSLTNPNGTGGFMTAYFVITALLTVRPVSTATRRISVALLVVAIALASTDMSLGVVAMDRPTRSIEGVPFFMFFFLGAVLALSAIGDVRILKTGPLCGGPRLARHLWRMCFALFLAAGSFFPIRARVVKVLPEFFATPVMRALPVALVFVAMFYWLWRVRGRRVLPTRR